ncbi:hypothetical protein BDZ91DRAFT_724321 [Kalaharituber pfeilii]|nr:hypothetical protein BDZ91DRAFT_724321 [Kalaharituber pfeilii]
MTYRDVDLTLQRDNAGKQRWTIQYHSRLWKYQRHTEQLSFTLNALPETPLLCPVLLTLALAFDDYAFKVPDMTPTKLLGLKIVKEARTSLHVEWKESMLDVPIFRKMQTNRVLSPKRALDYNTAQEHVKHLGEAFGFRGPITFYCSRRGAANAIDKDSTEA